MWGQGADGWCSGEPALPRRWGVSLQSAAKSWLVRRLGVLQARRPRSQETRALWLGAGLSGWDVGAWRRRLVFGGAGARPPVGSFVAVGGKVMVGASPWERRHLAGSLPGGSVGSVESAGSDGSDGSDRSRGWGIIQQRRCCTFQGEPALPRWWEPWSACVAEPGVVLGPGIAAGETAALPRNAGLLFVGWTLRLRNSLLRETETFAGAPPARSLSSRSEHRIPDPGMLSVAAGGRGRKGRVLSG
jgi:hypothetical protein